MIDGYLGRQIRYPGWKRRVGAMEEASFFPRWTLAPSSKKSASESDPKAPRIWKESLENFFRETSTRVVRLRRGDEPSRVWEARPGDAQKAGRTYSLTKSLFALLWAAVRRDGIVPPDDASLGDCGLELRDREARRLTLDQLWRMASGLKFRESLTWGTEQIRTFLHPDARRTALNARLVETPGKDFHYNDFHTLLLGIVLERSLEASGLKGRGGEPTLVRAWRERLWEPLGVDEPGAWVLDSRNSNFPKTESGLVLTSRTIESFGRLLIDRGQHNGRQLWDQAWLDEGLERGPAWNRPEDFSRYTASAWGSWLARGYGWYGRHWWALERRGETAWFGLGIHGQVLLVRPAVQGTAVRLGDRWSWKGWWPEFLFDLLDEPALLN